MPVAAILNFPEFCKRSYDVTVRQDKTKVVEQETFNCLKTTNQFFYVGIGSQGIRHSTGPWCARAALALAVFTKHPVNPTFFESLIFLEYG